VSNICIYEHRPVEKGYIHNTYAEVVLCGTVSQTYANTQSEK
jgi:hypothetical protein